MYGDRREQQPSEPAKILVDAVMQRQTQKKVIPSSSVAFVHSYEGRWLREQKREVRSGDIHNGNLAPEKKLRESINPSH